MLPFVLAVALQAGQATILGTVADVRTAEPLRGAVVALTDLGRFAMSDSAGHYSISDVPAGPQHVSVNLVGYGTRTLHALVPAAGQIVINLLLQAEPIPVLPITVHARVAVRDADRDPRSGYAQRSASAAEIRNHPLLAEPDAFQVLGGGYVTIMPESPSGIHIRGGFSDHTAYVLDGVPILNPYHAAGLFSAWNPDALSEVHILPGASSALLPDALAGVVAGSSRAAVDRFAAQGSLTTTQARATIDGAMGRRAGYMLSVRSSYPAFIAPRAEDSYLSGETADLFARLEFGFLGGNARLLAYDSENEVRTAVTANAPNDSNRNEFEWRSRSVGLTFTRSRPGYAFDFRAWSASSAEDARWSAGHTAITLLDADYRDTGAALALQLPFLNALTTAGLRFTKRNTSYTVFADSAQPWPALQSTTPVIALFLAHTRALRGFELDVNGTLASSTGRAYPGAYARLSWRLSDRFLLAGSISHKQQFSQSLRNLESLVGNVFPVDLRVGSDRTRIPVARANEFDVSLETRPRPGVHAGLQAYQRNAYGLVLIPVRDSQPFATTNIETGPSRSRGVAFEVSVSAARIGLVGSYGWQHTRIAYGGGSFVPEYAAAHNAEAGIVVFPSATLSFRLGAVAAFGRRASGAVGTFEWEACNLLDRGCEFAGSPLVSPGQLGANALPAYLRVDAGVRKHWHMTLRRRDAVVALFGTATNLFGRKNILNFTYDAATNTTTAVEMRPFSPLVVGLDWRF